MDILRFSRPFQLAEGSPIRELFPYLSQPGLISFAGGYPSPALFDLEGLQEASQRAASHRAVFQYSSTEGVPALREQLAALSATRGITIDADNLLVTTGSQQAFDLLTRVLLEPGDTVLVEAPTYPATLQTLRLAGANVIPVPTDAHGIDTEQLAQWLATHGETRCPRLLYTVPTYSNPGGTLLSAPRRRQLVSLARQHGFLVVEDDPYGDLNFTGVVHETLYALGLRAFGPEANPVLYLSSLSKTVAPALRVGWLIAPGGILRRCAIAKQTADLCSSSLTQHLALEYLRLGRYTGSVERMTQAYRERADRLGQELTRQLGATLDFVVPSGGMFLWGTLRSSSGMDALFQAAVAEGVLYVPGKAFYLPGPSATALRLSFASTPPEDIPEGVSRLARALAAPGVVEPTAD
ncbi:MAG: PLP-dependent aminotransferase family protein [Pigmentiphaga sp.]